MLGSFKLDEDQRNDVYRLVRSFWPGDWFTVSKALSERAESSILAWIAANEGCAGPQDYTPLRNLVQALTSSHTPSIGIIRTRIFALHPSIVRRIEARAGDLAASIPTFRPIASDFRGWAKAAPAAELIPTLQSLLIDGGCRVAGRNRPNGKQSRSRIQPSIAVLPNTRKNVHGQAGGRPERDDLWLLLSFLAADWLLSTGLQPDKGRSDNTPFGALVFMVFRWIGEEDKAAHSLRTFWSPPRPRPKKKLTAALSQG